jgi:hypothetical protein
MAGVDVGLRISAAVLVLACACSKPEQPPNEDKDPPLAEAAPAAPVDPCHALAQLYCEHVAVQCSEVEQLLREANVPEQACSKAVGELEATLAAMPESDRVILPMVLARYLPTVLLESPTLTPEQRAKFEEMARSPSGPDGYAR